jgi:hypothetical protein
MASFKPDGKHLAAALQPLEQKLFSFIRESQQQILAANSVRSAAKKIGFNVSQQPIA